MSQASSQTGRIAIVTGGSRGIGRSTVEHLARHGVRVIFTYHTHREDADAVVAATKALGSEAYTLQLDTGRVKDVDAFAENVRGVLAQLGKDRFDYLLNNAGNNHRNMQLAVVTEDEMDGIYSVHFKSVLRLAINLELGLCEDCQADGRKQYPYEYEADEELSGHT